MLAIATVASMATSCSDDSWNHKLEADPNVFAVYPVALAAEADGGEYQIRVNGHETWETYIEEENGKTVDWVTVTPTSGTGAAEITLNVEASRSFTNRRNFILHVVSGNKDLRFRLIQGTLTLGDKEVLINGNVWSTVNVNDPGTFCESPDEIGKVYQFNSKTAWNFESNNPGWSMSYDYDEVNWQPENDPCPEGYRVPTTAEMAALWEIGSTWVSSSKTGFKANGIIIGVDAETAALVNKDNINSMGALFLPQSGWISGDGLMDRTWLVAVRSSTSLSRTHGGMSLGDSGGYRDTWGWGDGQKERAAMIRPIKDLELED